MEGIYPIITSVLAYVLGGISAGYWLVRLRTGGDVRDFGSRSTGATNTGRVLGRGGFAAVLVLDAGKGALAVGCARLLSPEGPWTALAALAVVVGHIWPIQLGFRGGKGIAPMIGAWLALAPLALLPCLLLGLLVLTRLRRMTLSGLCGLVLLPLGAWWSTHAWPVTLAGAATLVVCLVSHRDHLRGVWTRGPDQRENGPMPAPLPTRDPKE